MKKYLWLIPVIFVGLIAIAVQASPSTFTSSAKTASATSTVTYLLAASTATTTLTYDTWELSGDNQTNQSNTWVADSVALKIILTASSTNTTLRARIQYSDDKIDWYESNLETYAAGAIALATPNSYSWSFASTTPNNYNSETLTRGLRIVELKVPLRYVRVVLSVIDDNGAVYAELSPKKQVR